MSELTQTQLTALVTAYGQAAARAARAPRNTSAARCAFEVENAACASLLAAIGALVADREKLAGWQPIETAPKDTEVFIGAFVDEEFHFGRSVFFYEQGNEFEGETWSGWVWSIDDCSESVAEHPTHWMPIPAAPEVQS